MATTTHTVIDATSGAVLLQGATTAQFDRWYDHHCFYRQPRCDAEVRPDLRDAWARADRYTHFLIED